MQNPCEQIPEVDGTQLKEMLDKKGAGPPLLVDVRQPEEYRAAHIPGALLIPLGQLELPHPALKDTHRPTVVYCRSGRRSMVGARILCARGFTRVMSLKEGILGWNFETLSGPPRPAPSGREVPEVLRAAAAREVLAQESYRHWAENSTSGPLKTLLEEMADREGKHLAAIFQRHLSWSREHGLPPGTLEDFKKGAAPEAPVTPPAFSSREELLELAVDQEFQAYNFYRIWAEESGDPELRGLLFDLSFEERAHASLLLEMLTLLDA